MSTNWSKIESQLRLLLGGFAGYFVGAGYLSADLANLIIGLVLAVGGVLWSYWVNRDVALVQAAEGVSNVSKIQLFDSASSTKMNAQTGSKVILERRKK